MDFDFQDANEKAEEIDAKAVAHFKLRPAPMSHPDIAAAMLAAMQSYAAYMRENVPGVMAITAGVDAKDPSLVHDLQGLYYFLGHIMFSLYK